MATRTSITTGAWDNIATWDTGIPVMGDTAIIGHNVYLDSDVAVGTSASGQTQYAITINNGGTLRWANPPSGSWSLVLYGGIRVNVGGTLQVGTQGSPIPSAYTADIFFSQGSNSMAWRIFNYGGTVDFHGASSYHMGTSSMQRAKISGNISAGDVYFDVDRAADWEVGDWIGVGCGADKTYVPTPTTHRPERVQITEKITSSNFRAVFTYDHKDGDHILALDRNVIIRGNGNLRGCRIYADHGGQTGTPPTKVRLTWMKFRYAGHSSTSTYAAVSWNVRPSSQTEFLPADALIINNVVFDEAGDTSGTFSTEYGRSYGIYVYPNIGFTDVTCIEDIYTYGMGRVLALKDVWELEVTRIVAMALGYLVADTESNVWDIRLDDIWICAKNWNNTQCVTFDGEFEVIDNVECFNIYQARTSFASAAPKSLYVGTQRMRNWKIYACASDAVIGMAGRTGRILIEDWEVYQTSRAAIRITTGGNGMLIKDCSFDNCNITGTSTYAAAILVSTMYPGADIIFQNCTFGTVARNYLGNIITGMANGLNRRGRFRAESCDFIEPINWSTYVGSYKYYNETQVWSMHIGDRGDWRSRIEWGTYSTELANCTVRNSSLVDQWAIDYPGGVRHLARTMGGGEMNDEPTIKIDNTFCRKLLPFSAMDPMWANMHGAIKIPVESGQTVTVNLSMRKTKDGIVALPGIRLEGPGIFNESFMTSSLLNTWEELTVTGVSDNDGMCYFFVSGGTNNHGESSTVQDELYGPPPVTLAWMNMFDCIVYADGLSISVV